MPEIRVGVGRIKHFSFRYRVRVPHPRRVFVFAARVGFLYTIRRNVLGRCYALGASHGAEGAAELVMPVSR